MGGGKGGSTTVNKTEIPPEVLARYNAVNARAETVAQQPYQRYSNDPNAFVAGLTPTQMAGIQNVNAMAGAAQPYYGAATQQLGQAQQQGQGYLGAATGQLGAAQQTGQALGSTAGEQYAQAANVAAPYYQAATANLGAGLGLAAPLNLAAAQSAFGAAGAAAPYYGAATRGTQAAIRGAQPYQTAATQAALAGSQAVSPGQLQTVQFLNPYTQNVVAATQAALGQQFGQQQAQQQAEAIRAGAFGGDRSGLQRAQLRGQQALAESQAIAPLYQQAYQNALQTAQQQQGVNLSAEQANRAALQGLSPQLAALGQQGYGQQLGAAQQMAGLGQALYGQGMTGAQTLSQLGQAGFGQQLSAAQQAAALGQGLYGQALGLGQAIQGLGQQQYGQGAQTAQQLAALGQQGYGMGAGTSSALANLGTNAQQAGLAGAQAQLQAGQQQQQTEQAGKQAMYNQFMQEQGYPFQVAQFLANIATGTGALSGNQSTSTTTGGGGFFSDKRLKENVQKVGETNDGQPIYRYNYKGDPRTQIGLMAQDVEKEHPEAVGLAGGYKTVDYKKATEDAVHKADGGGTTDAYAITPESKSQMLAKPTGLGALQLPQMKTEGIAVRSMTPASEIEALRAPKATGFSPGTMEANRAEAASLRSALSSGRGADLGSGPEYMQSRLSELDRFLGQNSSQGGLVGPEGGAFARGGFAFGGGPYGVQLEPMQVRQMMQAQPGQRPAERNALAEAKQIGDLASLGYAGYKNRPDFLRSDADIAARKTSEAAAKVAELQKLEWAKEKGIDVDTLLGKAHGGLIGDREAYRDRGYVNSSSNPYSGISEGYLDDTLQTQQQTPRPSLDVKGAPKPQPAKSGLGETINAAKSLYKGGEWAADKLGLGASPTAMSATSAEALPGVIDLTSGAGLAGAAPEAAAAAEGLAGAAGAGEALAGGAAAAEGLAGAAGLAELGTGLAAAGTTALEALPFLAFLSDERAKHDIKKVGTLFDGQPVYRYAYNGDDKTQMGLLAQKVEKVAPEAVGLAGGMKTVNYKKATDKAAKRKHYQRAGLVVPDEYSTAEPDLAGAEGGTETTTQGGDGKTVVGHSAPLVRTTRPVPTPESAIAAVPAPRAREPGVASGSRPSIPDLGGLVPEGMKDTLSSENFWVPALAGIGSMLASPNKTFLGAVGSGLVGGTTAYTDLQKQQADQLMKRLEMSKGRFKGPVLVGDKDMYQDTVAGDYVTQEEMARRQNQFIGGKGSGAAATAPALPSTPGGRAAVDAVDTAKKIVTEEPPTVQPRAPAPPAKKEEIAAPTTTQPAAATSAPKAAEPDPNRILTKPEMIAAARQNESLFQHLPEERRPLALEAEAKRLEDEGKTYLRQSQEEARRSGLTMGAEERVRLEAASKRFAELAKDRREEAAKRREEANNLFEGAIASQLKEAEARIARTVERDFAEEIAPSGEKVRLPPGVKMPSAVAPEPTAAQQTAPKVAEVDPKTARLVLARPVAPAGGGLIQPTNLPPGTKVSEISTAAKNQSTMDEQFQKDFMEKAPSVGQARQRYMGLVNAFKLFESGSAESTLAGWAAVAQSFGYPEIARGLASGDPAAVQWTQKIGPNLVLETLKAATPRFAQSEFMTLQEKGTPEPNKLPQANFQMVKEGLATLNRTDAFMQAWQNASQEEGWRSPSAYYAVWSKANPIEKFEQSAERQMGNFAGMPLPKASEWAPGAVYVVPKSLSTEQKAFFDKRGLKAGDAFQYGGAEAPPDQVIRPIPKQQLYSIPAMRQ